MAYGESAIEAVNWQALEVLRGSGEDVRSALLALFRSASNSEAEQLWRDFENVVFSQDTVYGAAEETVGVLLAALADERPHHVRSWILELLFFLLKGGSSKDPSLPLRCRQRALPGLWLLARQARETHGPERELAINVVESIEPAYAELMREGLR